MTFRPSLPVDDLHISDATFREGQQSGHAFTPAQTARLFALLHRLGGPRGLIRSSEFFLYTPRDRAAVDACRSLDLPFPRVTAWARADVADIRMARDMGIPDVSLLMSVSGLHLEKKLGWTTRAAMDRYLAALDAALDLGLTPRCHFEDVTRADIAGFCLPLAQAILARCPGCVIRLCDTLGLALPYAGAPSPIGVEALVTAFRQAGVPGEQLEFHGHNDFAKAHVNSVAAWLAGCAGANGSLLGLGERCGAAAVEALAVEHRQLTGDDGADLTALGDIALALREAGVAIPEAQPLLGSRAFAHVAGLHLDGVAKDPATYESLDPQAVFGLPSRPVITDKSGRAGIAAWIGGFLGKDVAKEHPLTGMTLESLRAAFEAGRQTPFTDGELAALVCVNGWAHLEVDPPLLRRVSQDMDQALELLHALWSAGGPEMLGQFRHRLRGLRAMRHKGMDETWTEEDASLAEGTPFGMMGVVVALDGGALAWRMRGAMADGTEFVTEWDVLAFWPAEAAAATEPTRA